MKKRREHIIITAGEFDPLNVEEIQYLERCKEKGDWLIVGVHSDNWMRWCVGTFFNDFETRKKILASLRCVDETFGFNDSDGTVCSLLRNVKICYPNATYTYVSPESIENMPESKIRGIRFETMK